MLNTRATWLSVCTVLCACSFSPTDRSADGGSPGGGTGKPGQTGSGGPTPGVVCLVGSKGCACDPLGGCAPGNICKAGGCCDQASGDCKSPATSVPGSVSGGTGAGATACTPGASGPVVLTSCGYPYSSSNPLTNVDFNESEVLRAIVPSGGYPTATIKVFYNDEHALNLGVRSVTVNGTTTNYPVSALPASPASLMYPQVGAQALTGDQAGIDGEGRPMWPVLYITDTTFDPTSTAGDWQQGGKPWNPVALYGTWKSSVRTDGVVTTDKADPAKNNWNLSTGGGPVPPGLTDEGFGAEVRWYISLIAGHSYRIQTMVHDGDSKNGGDVGEACVNFCAFNCEDSESCPTEPRPDSGTPTTGGMCPVGVVSCAGTAGASCPPGTSCTGGCCAQIIP
jgi:hypothetical protein